MTLEECYAALGGDFADVLGRFRSRQLVEKFLLRFLEDGSYDELCRALPQGDRETAFRAVHTLKGVCQNLSFTRLAHSSSELCESLRYELCPDAPEKARQVDADYACTLAAIQTYRAGLPTKS